MRTVRPWLFLASMLALAGCGASAAGLPEACTEMAARQGIGVRVAEQIAATSRTADLRVCQGGDCRKVSIELRPSSAAVDQGCDGSVCAATASPTGQRYGFADLPELNTAKARVRVVLRTADNASVVDRAVTVTPELVYPNGPDCGGEAPQAHLRVTDTGAVRVT